jgi:hypothetical protein
MAKKLQLTIDNKGENKVLNAFQRFPTRFANHQRSPSRVRNNRAYLLTKMKQIDQTITAHGGWPIE